MVRPVFTIKAPLLRLICSHVGYSPTVTITVPTYACDPVTCIAGTCSISLYSQAKDAADLQWKYETVLDLPDGDCSQTHANACLPEPLWRFDQLSLIIKTTAVSCHSVTMDRTWMARVVELRGPQFALVPLLDMFKQILLQFWLVSFGPTLLYSYAIWYRNFLCEWKSSTTDCPHQALPEEKTHVC